MLISQQGERKEKKSGVGEGGGKKSWGGGRESGSAAGSPLPVLIKWNNKGNAC